MSTFFLACALLGGGVVVLQLLLAVVGLDHAAPHDVHVSLGHAHVGHAHAGHGQAGGDATGSALHLTSVRALAAALAFFGLTGWALLRAGRPGWLALTLGGGAGVAALFAVALLLRALLRLESDGTVRIENALWQPATVYVPIPGGRAGAGKVTLSLQGRLVEYQAVTPDVALPTGAPVTVVDVVAPDTLEVVATPNLLEEAR